MSDDRIRPLLARVNPPAVCEHCWHVEKRADCRRFGLDRKLIERCCKCEQTQPLKF